MKIILDCDSLLGCDLTPVTLLVIKNNYEVRKNNQHAETARPLL